MEMLNRAIEGADAFKKMLEQTTKLPQTSVRGNENRQQRRAREREEKKTVSRSVKA